MNAVAQLAALIGALTYLAAVPFETVWFTRPAARRFLHVETEHVAELRMWAFVVGVRNLLAGVAVIVGLVILRTADQAVGQAVVLTACGYMVLAGLAMGLADALGYWRPRGGSVLGTVASSLPPLVAVVATTV